MVPREGGDVERSSRDDGGFAVAVAGPPRSRGTGAERGIIRFLARAAKVDAR